MPAKTSNPHIPFDNTSFGALMRSADSDAPSLLDQDECARCGEHMLDCECEPATAEYVA